MSTLIIVRVGLGVSVDHVDADTVTSFRAASVPQVQDARVKLGILGDAASERNPRRKSAGPVNQIE